MHYSTIVVTSLLAAFASASSGIPAKRQIGGLFSKRQAEGNVCASTDLAGGTKAYTVCAADSTCKEISGSWCCCKDPNCTTCDGCGDGQVYGADYKCVTAGGKTFYAPTGQSEAISSAMVAPQAQASSVLSEASAAASSVLSEASAVVSSAEAAASSAEAAASSQLASASQAASGVVASASGALASASASASGALASASASASGIVANATGTGQPTATGPAANSGYKVVGSAPALALAILAGILML